MKRILNGILLLVLVISAFGCVSVSASEIDDSELQAAIEFLKEQKIIMAKFNPEENITRKDFAVMVCKFKNSNIKGVTAEENIFDDVDTGENVLRFIISTYQNGFMIGYGNDVFGGNDLLTEEQAITALSRMFGDDVGAVKSIEDEVNTLGGYSDGYVVYAEKSGIESENLLGNEAQKKMPITKGKVAKLLYQLYNIKNA